MKPLRRLYQFLIRLQVNLVEIIARTEAQISALKSSKQLMSLNLKREAMLADLLEVESNLAVVSELMAEKKRKAPRSAAARPVVDWRTMIGNVYHD